MAQRFDLISFVSGGALGALALVGAARLGPESVSDAILMTASPKGSRVRVTQDELAALRGQQAMGASRGAKNAHLATPDRRVKGGAGTGSTHGTVSVSGGDRQRGELAQTAAGSRRRGVQVGRI